MKGHLIAIFLMAASPAVAQTLAEPAATAPSPKYSVQTTTCGELANNPQTRAIFEKFFPEVLHHPQFNMGLDLTLPEVVQYLPDVVTPPKLAAMDAELRAIP